MGFEGRPPAAIPEEAVVRDLNRYIRRPDRVWFRSRNKGLYLLGGKAQLFEDRLQNMPAAASRWDA